MIISVYGEKAAEKMIRLKLRQNSDDSVDVLVANEDGDTVYNGLLLNISHRGVRLYPAVSENFGIALDGAGRLDLSDFS
jgi:hypothetical protein